MQRLRRCKDELEAGQLMEKNKHIYETYFTVRETPKRGRTVEYNDKAIQDYIENDSCYWVLMSMPIIAQLMTMKEQTRCLQLKTYLWLYFGILGYTRGQKQEKLQ